MSDFLYDHAMSLASLLNYNQKRLSEHMKKPFFKMLEDGTLNQAKKREIFLACLFIWSKTFQQIMFTRQATSVDKKYRTLFLAHLREELGHDELLIEYENKVTDCILTAIATWFVHRMIVLDNIEKTALIHLVLEVSGNAFHTCAAPLLKQYLNTDYFSVHAELDQKHTDMGVELLKNQNPETYLRLHALIEESWDMFEALIDRIVYLVNADYAT